MKDDSITKILDRFDAAIEKLRTDDPDPVDEGAVKEVALETSEVEAPDELTTGIVPAVPAVEKVAAPEELTDIESPEASDVAVPEVVEAFEDRKELEPVSPDSVLEVRGLNKRFGATIAADEINLTVKAGTIFGVVGPNGAGKTTLLGMISGMLRPDSGRVIVKGANVWEDPAAAKRSMGIMPDRLRVFDRLTGQQLLHYSGVLRGLDAKTVNQRSTDLAGIFELREALPRLVSDYSAGMVKKLALAAAIIHSPRILILDEPFESVDPVSAESIIRLLRDYVAAGGSVVLSSHSLGLIENICHSVAIIIEGRVLATGSVDEVRGDTSLEDRLIELANRDETAEGMEWLHSFSD